MLSLANILPLHLADLKFPEGHPLHGQSGQVFAFMIHHKSGVVLFETGIGRGNQQLDRLYQVVHYPIEAQLELHQLRLADVSVIVNSHLHFDHCGGNSLFPGIPIYVQASEYSAANHPSYTIPQWVHLPDANYVQIAGDREIAASIRVLATPGHTPGHQSMMVETSAGPVVLAGQAIYSKAEYGHIRDTGVIPPDDPPPDKSRYLLSAQRLIRLQARRVFFSHDGEIWEREP